MNPGLLHAPSFWHVDVTVEVACFTIPGSQTYRTVDPTLNLLPRYELFVNVGGKPQSTTFQHKNTSSECLKCVDISKFEKSRRPLVLDTNMRNTGGLNFNILFRYRKRKGTPRTHVFVIIRFFLQQMSKNGIVANAEGCLYVQH